MRIAPNSAASGQDEAGVRADGEPDDVRRDEPDEADQAGDGDGGGGRERGEAEEDRPLAPDVDAEVRGRLLAEEEAVERAGANRDQRGRAER